MLTLLTFGVETPAVENTDGEIQSHVDQHVDVDELVDGSPPSSQELEEDAPPWGGGEDLAAVGHRHSSSIIVTQHWFI